MGFICWPTIVESQVRLVSLSTDILRSIQFTRNRHFAYPSYQRIKKVNIYVIIQWNGMKQWKSVFTETVYRLENTEKNV